MHLLITAQHYIRHPHIEARQAVVTAVEHERDQRPVGKRGILRHELEARCRLEECRVARDGHPHSALKDSSGLALPAKRLVQRYRRVVPKVLKVRGRVAILLALRSVKADLERVEGPRLGRREGRPIIAVLPPPVGSERAVPVLHKPQVYVGHPCPIPHPVHVLHGGPSSAPLEARALPAVKHSDSHPVERLAAAAVGAWRRGGVAVAAVSKRAADSAAGKEPRHDAGGVVVHDLEVR